MWLHHPIGTISQQENARHDATVRPIDRRLLSLDRPTRVNLVAAVGIGTLRTTLLIAQAWLIATVVASSFISGRDLAELVQPLALLLAVVFARALLAWSADTTGARCSARVKSSLRKALGERTVRLGSDGEAARTPGDVATLAVRGIDALDGYFARYVPQVALAVTAPVAILLVVLAVDWLSAVILIVTLPLIPVFMALIGVATRENNERQLRGLQVLSGHFLDVVSGLTTLKIFGRSKAQSKMIAAVTETYRRRLMRVLRVTFLSSLVLELLASVSVALIAVAIGLRLLAGHVDLRTSLFVLILAPEAYLPIRQMAADYHASAEGRSAAAQVFEFLDELPPDRGSAVFVPDPAETGLFIDALRFTYPGRAEPAIDGVTLEIRPGEFVAITGPTGCGKSTLLSCVLGLAHAQSGHIFAGNIDLRTLDPDAWRARIGWVPQRPHLFATTIADNIRLGRPYATRSELNDAASAAGLDSLLSRLPRGWDTRIGEGGTGISAGERQRVALARAFLRDAPLLLLDEPTANVDGQTESDVISAVRALSAGRTVLMVAHRRCLLAVADRVVDLTMAGVAA
jgi:thiol reductant ABC exporter CydD subunit